MQKFEETLLKVSVTLTESQVQKVEDLMMVLGLNRSAVIREAIELMAEIHEYDLSQYRAKEG